jgi:hypothetical protein
MAFGTSEQVQRKHGCSVLPAPLNYGHLLNLTSVLVWRLSPVIADVCCNAGKLGCCADLSRQIRTRAWLLCMFLFHLMTVTAAGCCVRQLAVPE